MSTGRISHALDYDQMAADYARHRQVHPGVFSRLLAGGQVTEPSNVLEVGSGTGNYIIALHTLTGCLGFGLERVVMALFKTHGFEPDNWPKATRDLLFQ